MRTMASTSSRLMTSGDEASMQDIFSERYQRLYGDTKHKEAIRHLRCAADFDYRTYVPRL